MSAIERPSSWMRSSPLAGRDPGHLPADRAVARDQLSHLRSLDPRTGPWSWPDLGADAARPSARPWRAGDRQAPAQRLRRDRWTWPCAAWASRRSSSAGSPRTCASATAGRGRLRHYVVARRRVRAVGTSCAGLGYTIRIRAGGGIADVAGCGPSTLTAADRAAPSRGPAGTPAGRRSGPAGSQGRLVLGEAEPEMLVEPRRTGSRG
jgi:hypothetical protein